MTQRSCGTCKFSGPIDNPVKVANQDGKVECRYNPPIIANANGVPIGNFPMVERTKWCGKFEHDASETRSAA